MIVEYMSYLFLVIRNILFDETKSNVRAFMFSHLKDIIGTLILVWIF